MIDTEVIMTLWNRFTAFLSGWPQGTKEGKKLKEDNALFKEEAARGKNKPKIKPKKVKGLNPKKKKAKKQGNIS